MGKPDESSPKPDKSPTPEPAWQALRQSQSDPVEGNPIAPDHTNSTPGTGNPAAPTLSPPGDHPVGNPQRIPHWLQQAERFLRAIVRIYIGLAVCIAPWLPLFWDNNPLFMSSPGLFEFVTHGAVRGVVSGLGLLNLWIALRDALRNPAEPIPR